MTKQHLVAFASENKPLKAWVKQNEAKLTLRDYNTNNAWGFGGSYGTEYLLPDGKTFVRIGTACTRHAGTSYIELAGRKPEFECRDNVYTRLTVGEFLALDIVTQCGKVTV